MDTIYITRQDAQECAHALDKAQDALLLIRALAGKRGTRQYLTKIWQDLNRVQMAMQEAMTREYAIDIPF